MDKTLYLHIGMPKCASTSVQEMLHINKHFLKQKGKFYGKTPWDQTQKQGNATRLVSDIRGKATNNVEKAYRFFFERDSDVVLSSEVLIGIARNRLAEELIETAKSYGFDTRLICFFRRQDHWIESDYKQHLKGGSTWSQGLMDLVDHRSKTRTLDYFWMIENWERFIPTENIKIVPIESGQNYQFAPEELLKFLGIDQVDFHQIKFPKSHNVSPSTSLIEPMRYLKMLLLSQGLPPQKVQAELSQFLKNAPQDLNTRGRNFLLKMETRRNLVKQYEDSNRNLAQKYLGRDQLFNLHFEADAETKTSLEDEAAMVLAEWSIHLNEELKLLRDNHLKSPKKYFWNRSINFNR